MDFLSCWATTTSTVGAAQNSENVALISSEAVAAAYAAIGKIASSPRCPTPDEMVGASPDVAGVQVRSTAAMKPEDDCIDTERIHSRKATANGNCRAGGQPRARSNAASLVAGVRSRLRILCAPTVIDPRPHLRTRSTDRRCSGARGRSRAAGQGFSSGRRSDRATGRRSQRRKAG